MQSRYSYKTTSRIVGSFFILAIFAYSFGDSLVQSVIGVDGYLSTLLENKTQLGVGALLMLLNSLFVVSIGVLLFPILKEHNKNAAYFYLTARVIEGVFLTMGVVALLLTTAVAAEYVQLGSVDSSYFEAISSILKQGNFFAYQIAMATLGLGSLLFCYTLYTSRLLPKVFAALGLLGYFVFLCGAIAEILGFKIGLLLSIPGGLWELAFGIWLIVRGFKNS